MLEKVDPHLACLRLVLGALAVGQTIPVLLDVYMPLSSSIGPEEGLALCSRHSCASPMLPHSPFGEADDMAIGEDALARVRVIVGRRNRELAAELLLTRRSASHEPPALVQCVVEACEEVRLAEGINNVLDGRGSPTVEPRAPGRISSHDALS